MSRRINRVIIHYALTPDSGDQYGLKDINEWHQKRGFWDPVSKVNCGYHYVVRRSGIVEVGRLESEVGAHTFEHNEDSVGVVFMCTRRWTEMQIDAYITLVDTILSRNHLSVDDVYGHYELHGETLCPGQDMGVLRRLLKNAGCS